MRVVLDTNIVSELIRPIGKRNTGVVAWFEGLALGDIRLNCITEAETRSGAYGHRDSARRQRIIDYWNHLARQFPVLEFSEAAVLAGALFRGKRKLRGREISFADAAIAGIALVENCALATRNVKGFEGASLTIVNPFSE